MVRPKALPITGFAACNFDGVAIDLVHQFKRGGALELARFMSEPMAAALAGGDLRANWANEAGTVNVAAVPSRPDSFRRRGFVPARLLVRALVARLRRQGLDAREFTGVRLNRKVSDQALLNLQQRAANLAGAITVGPPPVPGTQLVLVDDVVTTGATIGEMYRAATESGWNCKFFVSFAETL